MFRITSLNIYAYYKTCSTWKSIFEKSNVVIKPSLFSLGFKNILIFSITHVDGKKNDIFFIDVDNTFVCASLTNWP